MDINRAAQKLYILEEDLALARAAEMRLQCALARKDRVISSLLDTISTLQAQLRAHEAKKIPVVPFGHN